ncbi:MAG: hypothetical protein IPK82_29185 [Polyangiaceae bacterium]|nr:hypothetical protein [Polyangiaceae bacterium]
MARGLSVEETLALWSTLPVEPVVSRRAAADTMNEGPYPPRLSPEMLRATTSLFDRLFNTAQWVEKGGTFPKPTQTLLHVVPGSTSSSPSEHLARVLSGLGVTEEELTQLVEALGSVLGVNVNSTEESERRWALTVANLSTLYKHARLARHLNMPVADLFQLLQLTPQLAAARIGSLADLEAVFEFHAWWKASGRTLSDLTTLVENGLSASKLAEPHAAFVRAHLPLFGLTATTNIPKTALRRLVFFERWSSAALAAEAGSVQPADLPGLLSAFHPASGFPNDSVGELAKLLGCDPALARGLQELLPNRSNTPFEALQELSAAADLAKTLGIGGQVLSQIGSTNYGQIAAAARSLQAALDRTYPDETERAKVVEPYRDAILSRRRDGLVASLIHTGPAQFDQVSDLYKFYLVDVQLEGCARTSRVASAIDTLQLYVQRCLLNLEESAPGAANSVHVLPEYIATDEWEWRKNYRVWEANRKIFLYPENYLEPSLRDNKTPLFRKLEEELLSKEITNEAILEAYGHYLRGFDELAHLTIAGSYHEKDESERLDVLHLVGVSSDDPPSLYYRRVENVFFSANSPDRRVSWGPWEKMEVQVPVRDVAPIVHNGQLFVFWVRYVTKSLNQVKEGESRFVGYQHRASVEFTKRKLDGSWTAPQKLRLNEAPFQAGSFPASYQEDGVVLDPIVPKESDSIENFFFEFTLYKNFEPLYDNRTHEVPRDDYTLRGFEWEKLYPASGDQLFLRGVNFQMWSPVDLYKLAQGPRNELEDPANHGVPWLNPAAWALVILLSLGTFDPSSLLPPRLVWSRVNGGRRVIHSCVPKWPCFDGYTYATLLADEARFKQYESPLAAVDPAGASGVWTGPQWSEAVTDWLSGNLVSNPICSLEETAKVYPVNGALDDVIIETSRGAFYLQGNARSDGQYQLVRLGTSLSEKMANILFNQGLDVLLSTQTQMALAEQPTHFALEAGRVVDATHAGSVDYDGPMGNYLREVFFHIPFLIANHLNSQGRYEDAMRWYHRLFDPTSVEPPSLTAGLTVEQKQRLELDRVWRYREFRNLTVETLRSQLTNGEQLEAYRRDPFNPHAIARLRMTAYQKAIVMKYVDNLIDWGDDLFTRAFAQQNVEYAREATLKYILAQHILGDRPEELGDCGDGLPQPKTYANIHALGRGSELWMEVESVISAKKPGAKNAGRRWVDVEAERASQVTKDVAMTFGGVKAKSSSDDKRDGGSVRTMIAGVSKEKKNVRRDLPCLMCI